MTLSETFLVTQIVDLDRLDIMGALDFRSPFDELGELRAVLTTQQIAELTGLRRETLSRARPDSRFRRSTEQALGDLYAVVTRMRAASEGDIGQLAAILRLPQPLLEGRSIAQLLKEGKVDLVLEHLAAPTVASDAEVAERAPDSSASFPEAQRAKELIDADPELAARLPAIESMIRDHFGPDARIVHGVVTSMDEPDGLDHLYLKVHAALSFNEEIDRLADLLEDGADLLRPVLPRLTIGTL